MESFLRPGIGLENWVSRSNYPALNIVQTSCNEMSFYVNQNYAQPSSCIHRYSLRIDGISSIYAGFSKGTVITKPFIFKGKQLHMNYSTSAAGGIKVSILDDSKSPYKSFDVENSIESIGNFIDRIIKWKNINDLSSLEGKIVRLKIELKDANLYSLRFN